MKNFLDTNNTRPYKCSYLSVTCAFQSVIIISNLFSDYNVLRSLNLNPCRILYLMRFHFNICSFLSEVSTTIMLFCKEPTIIKLIQEYKKCQKNYELCVLSTLAKDLGDRLMSVIRNRAPVNCWLVVFLESFCAIIILLQ